jgi:hypothetical protein
MSSPLSAFADFLAPLTGAAGADFLAAPFTAGLAAVLAGAFAADFLTGTEFFFAAAVLATGFFAGAFAADLAGAFLAALAGAAFLAVVLLAVVFLAGAAFFGATYASFSANLRCLTFYSCYRLGNNKSPCQARSSTRATPRGCFLSVLLNADSAESRAPGWDFTY